MPASRHRGTPWYSSLTIDVLLRVFNNSIFHPFVASLIPLCLRAAEIPYSAPAFKNTVYWAIFVCIIHVLLPFNERIAYGKPRKVDFDEEVIVITGGASGLGRCLAEIYMLKGATVAVLDVQSAKGGNAVEGVAYYECDIGSPALVKEAWAKITEELGLPTILINNAGIAFARRLVDLPSEDVEKTFRTNTISQYHLTSLFIPPLLSHPLGGTIVTISSILSKLGASHLSAYTASKAALIAYHASITAELSAHPKIKTILVTPGQLSTEMFSNVQQGPVANFFGPVVEVQDLAMEIVRMIDQGKGGLIALPTYARWISCLDILPVGLQKLFRDLAGVDAAMARGSLLAEEAAAETSQVEVTDAEQEDSIVFVEKSK